MGVVLYQLKRYEEAMEQYKLAIQYNPSYSSEDIEYYDIYLEKSTEIVCTHYYIGKIFNNNLKNYKEAILYYEIAIEIDLSFSSPHNGLGIVYYNKKEYEKAIEEFNQAIEKIKRGEEKFFYSILIRNKARTMIKKKEYKNALDEIQKLNLQSDIEKGEYYFIKGVALYKIFQYKEAIIYLQKSISLSPQSYEEIYFYLVMCFIKSKNDNNNNYLIKDRL